MGTRSRFSCIFTVYLNILQILKDSLLKLCCNSCTFSLYTRALQTKDLSPVSEKTLLMDVKGVSIVNQSIFAQPVTKPISTGQNHPVEAICKSFGRFGPL